MAEKELDTVLKKFLQFKDKFHIFKDMNDADILSLTRDVRFKKFKAGELLMKQGDVGEEIFYILAGKCNVIANRAIVGSFGGGTLIGEIASITKAERTASVRAIQDTTVFSFMINYEHAEKFPLSFYKYYRNITLNLINKLEATNKK